MTQKHAILKLLMDRRYHSVGEIIGLYVAQYNTRIKELRDEDIDIKNVRYKDLSLTEKSSINRRRLVPPKLSDTFFVLVTPNNKIDYDNLTLKPTKSEQAELF